MSAPINSTIFSHNNAAGIAALAAAILLIVVFTMQHVGGLAACSLCVMQRWPHGVALTLGLIALLPITVAPAQRFLLALITLCFAITAGIAAYHSGVEYGWFEGPTACSGSIDGDTVEELKQQLLAQPIVLCEEVQWSLFGISLAGYNFLISCTLSIFCGASTLVKANTSRR